MTSSLAQERLVRKVAETAPDVDANQLPATVHLADLADQGLLDQGIQALLDGDAAANDIRPMAETIASLAEECMPTAFGLWAHRMALEYFARGTRSARAEQVFTDLRQARRVGSTAMAAGLKSLAGVGDLTITATPTDDGWLLNGRIAWASNLTDGAIVVLPARLDVGSADDGSSELRTIVVWLPIESAGFAPRHITGLLALDSTASGTVKLTDVAVARDQLLSDDLTSFARGFRPAFLVLQSAFCAGLIRRSLAETHRDLERADNSIFSSQVAEISARVDDFLTRWTTLASDLRSATARELLQLRLDGSHLACQVTRLETTLAGGRGYLTSSAASRRFREAAFLPVQSPSEGHLTWELSLLDSSESTPVTGRVAS